MGGAGSTAREGEPAGAPAAEGGPGGGAAGGDFRFEDVDCPLCGSGRWRLLGLKQGSFYGKHRSGAQARVVRCRDCALIYANPMPHPARDSAELYNEQYTAMLYEQRTPDARPLAYAELPPGDIDVVEGRRRLAGLERLLGGPGELLDVGCAGGTLLCVARERGWRAVGLEINEASARVARELNGAEVVVGPLQAHAGAWAGRFDAVHFNQVLEHVAEPLAFLRAVRGVLREGGAFFCGVPNEDGVLNQLAQLYLRLRGSAFTQMLSPTFPPYHVLGFSERTLRRALERCGLGVLRVEPVNYGGLDRAALREGKWLKALHAAAAGLLRPFGVGYGLDAYGRALPLAPAPLAPAERDLRS